MTRFIAIVWNKRADHAANDSRALIEGAEAARPGWSRRVDKPGLIIFESPARSRADAGVDLPGGRGVILGAVFAAGSDQSASAGELDCDLLLRRQGESLFGAVWGRYVAFIEDEPNASVYVARDPSGALGCFMAQRGWAFVFFSDPDDLAALALAPTSMDWTYLAQRLADNRVISRRTAINGVEELPPGWIARVGQGRRSERAVWTPRHMAARVRRTPSKEAAVALRESVESACQAWASKFDRAALRLSGGLDSAIVAGCIKHRIGSLAAINFVTPTPEGDERVFARAAARHAGLELREVFRRPADVRLESVVTIAPGVRPPLWLADGETDINEAAFAVETKAQAYFAGRGGDNVFFRSEGIFALADRARDLGLAPGLIVACWIHARATGRPFWRVARETAAMATKPPARIIDRKPPPFLSAKARALVGAREPDELDLPPGKRLHLFMIEDRLNYFDCRPHADYIYPLVSQPVLETCLALPTYVLSPGGPDRGLARGAFADLVPPEILARRSKGQTTGYLAQILVRNLAFLRAFLLDGALVGEDMLETNVLAGVLSEAGLMKGPEHMASIVGLVSIEAWLRARAGASRPATVVV